MKKRLLSLLLAAAMVVSATACGSGSQTTPSGNTEPTPTKAAKATQAVQATATPKPTATPVPVETMKFSQAPTVKSTEKVEDRLPVKDDIYIEQVDANGDPLEIGVYGDAIKLVGKGGGWDCSRPITESIIHYNMDGTYYPNVMKAITHSDDYKVWTFKLREGMKWSDGVPFTADDIVFWYEAVHKTNFDTKASWTALHEEGDPNKDFAVLTKVNDYEVTWTFKNPMYPDNFIETGDFKWCWAPKHYLEDLVPDTFWSESKVSDEQALINAKAKGLSFSSTKDLGKQVAYYFWNWPGIPTLNSHVLAVTADGANYKSSYCEYVRNEYYWKVDAKGQQLPYMDKITYTKVNDDDQALLLFRSGEIDLIEVAMKDISSTLRDMNGTGVLRTTSGTSWGSAQITFNYTNTDQKYADLFAKKEFRQAMSISVNRDDVSGLLSDGFLLPSQCAPQENFFGYSEEWTKKWTEYDVAAAKKLLEKCGLKMGSDGFYDFGDGTDLLITFYYVADSGNDKTYDVLSKFWAKAGIKTDYKEFTREAYDLKIDANEWMATAGPTTSIGGQGLRDRPAPYVPVAQSAEWYGEYGTYFQTEGAQGVKPVGDFQKLIDLYKQWTNEHDAAKKNEIELEIYKVHEENLWTIAYLTTAGTYSIINSSIHNYPDNWVSCDLYMYGNLAHYWTMFKK